MSIYDRMSASPLDVSTSLTYMTEYVIVTSAPYTPKLVPTYENTSAICLLPIEDAPAPFTISSDNRLLFDTELVGNAVKITQYGSAVNGTSVRSFVSSGCEKTLRNRNSIIDGGHAYVVKDDIYVDGGLCMLNGELTGIASVRLRTRERLYALPFGYGLSFAVFIPASRPTIHGGLVVPIVLIQEILEYQLGDYTKLYASMWSDYGTTYSDDSHIGIIRGQVLSQEPSDPYWTIRIDHRQWFN